jgi:hypothetical protein
MARRRGLSLLFVTVAALAVTAGIAAAKRPHQPPTRSLLPLGRGQVVVSLGDPPQWLPLSGEPTYATVFAGRPRAPHAGAGNLYIAFQSPGRLCARSVSGDHARPLLASGYFRAADLVSRQQSPFAPDGGAAAGVYEQTLGPFTLHQSAATRACVWLGSSERSSALIASQLVPLLNRTFAASVSNLPQPGAGGTAYTMNAVAGRGFTYSARTTACGRTASDTSQAVPAGTPASEAIAADPSPCPGDGTSFNFDAGGQSLGSLNYTVAQAQGAVPFVLRAGGCELDAVDQTPLSDAVQYVQQDGCRLGNLLVSPFRRGLPRGVVIEAEVDGGIADLAPSGTTVDLVLNGKP